MKVILLAALFFLTIHDMMSPTSASYGTPSVQSRIFPGRDPKIKDEEYSWKGTLIHIHDHGSRSCGASLISKEYALTSAGCVSHREGRYILRLGDPSDRKKNFQVNIRIIRTPEEFIGPLDGNDIALLTLQNPVTFNYIKPVHLPTVDPHSNKEVPPIGTELTYVGWGIDGKVMLTKLRSLSNSEARKELKRMMKNEKTFRGIKDNPLFEYIHDVTSTDDQFKEHLLQFVKNRLADTDYIFTKKGKGFGPCGEGGGLIYHEKTQEKKKKSVLGGVISIHFGPCDGEALTVSTRMEAFCKEHGSFCPGSGPTGQQHKLA